MANLRHEATYPADVAFVMKSLTSEAFLAEYAAEVGALDFDVAVERAAAQTSTRLRMTVPTAGVPAPFTKLVTPTVDIVEQRHWRAAIDAPPVTGSVLVDAVVGKRSARVSGDLEVASAPAGALFSVDATVSVSLRLLGDLAATLIKDLVTSVLRQQEKVMTRWIEA